jgi:phosphoribosyl 1,2-cyclic phosphate phosphodiesterase
MSGILRLTILGCGSSGGVPRIGGDWGACDPNEPKNRRTRCSLLVERKRSAEDPWGPKTTTSILVDTSPDMREQLLEAEVKRLDAVFLTHDHADQTSGFDDLRAFWTRDRKLMPVYMDPVTAKVMQTRFGYCFKQPAGSLYPPFVEARVSLMPGGETVVEGPGGPIKALVLGQDHGTTQSLGFRFGRAAYNNDVVELPKQAFAMLEGLDVWIADALQDAPHLTHSHVAKTLGWIERLKPARGILTNLHHTLDYKELDARTPENVSPAYDGMQVEVAD